MTLPFDSWAVRAAALFFGPFVHEDVAAAMAAAFIHEYDMPVAGAFATLYAGVFVSDILIFVLGRLALWGGIALGGVLASIAFLVAVALAVAYPNLPDISDISDICEIPFMS